LIVGPYIKNVLGSAHLDYVLHQPLSPGSYRVSGYGGLWHLVNQQGFTVGKLLHREFHHYLGEGGARWRAGDSYLAGEGQSVLHPEVATLGARSDRSRAGCDSAGSCCGMAAVCFWPKRGRRSGPAQRERLLVAFVLRFGLLDYFLGRRSFG